LDLYISENIDLKKQLEDLEENNRILLAKLQKVQNSMAQSDTAKFGTTLIVVIFFIAVLLGFWCPSIEHDNILQLKPTNDASANKSTANKSRLRSLVNDETNKNGKSSEIAVAEQLNSNVLFELNNDLLLDFTSLEGEKADAYINVDFDKQSSQNTVADIISNSASVDTSWSSSPPSPTRLGNTILNTSINSGRSKTGTAVELTKVRPFVPKPTVNNLMLANINKTKVVNEPQIIILNLSKNVVKSTTNVRVNTYNNLQQMDSTANQSLNILTTSPVKRPHNTLLNSAEFLPSKYQLIGPHCSVIKLSNA
jgi:hypothetical protein